MTTETTNWVDEVGQPAFECIAEMVAAATLDWDRLEELRAERAGHVDLRCAEEPETWEECYEDEAEELAELEAAAGDCESAEDAQTRIDEDPLSIELGGWWSPGGDPEPTEYRVLLTTGGPAVRIVGELGQYNQPSTARLEVQDWFKPWTEYPCDQDTLLEYVGRLYLGE